MGRPVKVALGRSYRLRNRATVKVINRREITTRINGEPVPYVFFVGLIVGTKQRYTWDGAGRYSPVAQGPLDIVAAA